MTSQLRASHLAARFEALGVLAVAAYRAIPDSHLDWQPQPGSNSPSTLMLHMAGALRHYVGGQIGNTGYVRNRDKEFGEPSTRTETLAEFEQAMSEVQSTLAAVRTDDLANPATEPDYYETLGEDLVGALVHFSSHVGQMIWIAKAVAPDAMDESWMTAHHGSGVWSDQNQ